MFHIINLIHTLFFIKEPLSKELETEIDCDFIGNSENIIIIVIVIIRTLPWIWWGDGRRRATAPPPPPHPAESNGHQPINGGLPQS